jgi:hypothetical protein
VDVTRLIPDIQMQKSSRDRIYGTTRSFSFSWLSHASTWIPETWTRRVA